MLRLGAQSKRDEGICKELVCVSGLYREKDRFASKQNSNDYASRFVIWAITTAA